MKAKFFVNSFLLFFNLVFGIDYPRRPEPFRFVNDFTVNKHFFSKEFSDELHSYLFELAKEKGTQMVVVAIDDLQGQDASVYAIGLLNEWQIGQKGKDNGILILIVPKTGNDYGRIFITTGYGMEGRVTDIFLGRVIHEKILPQFTEGNMEKGIWAGVLEIVHSIHPDFSYSGKMHTYGVAPSVGLREFMIVVIILLIFFLVRRWSSPVIYTGSGSMFDNFNRWGGGSYGGSSTGGGFGGFGGRGGGGGAGGSW